MKTWKGFNPDMTCRGFQYKEGGEYESQTDVELGERGFHSCVEPLDTFQYYNPARAVYHEVEVGDDAAGDPESDSKVVSKHIRIGSAVSIQNMIRSGVGAVGARIAQKSDQNWVLKTVESASGLRASAAVAQNNAAAAASGRHAAAFTGGPNSVSAASDSQSRAVADGNHSAAAASGVCSVAATSGLFSVAGTSGTYAVAAAAGVTSAATTCGGASTAVVSSSGSVATVVGKQSTAIADGDDSVAVAGGDGCAAMGKEGCWLMLVERDGVGRIVAAKAVRVGSKADGRRIKPGVSYMLVDGKIVERNWFDC